MLGLGGCGSITIEQVDACTIVDSLKKIVAMGYLQ